MNESSLVKSSPRPLFVMGMPRSGTRNLADIIQCHDEVVLQGEISNAVMKTFLELLSRLDKAHSSKSFREERWLNRKADFIYNSFSMMSKKLPLDYSGGEKYIGHKTPNSERFISAYNKHFGQLGLEPVFFYCIRNPLDVWSSLKNMSWNKVSNVEQFIDQYNYSYGCYVKESAACKKNIHIFNLDEYLRSDNKAEHLKKNVFDLLGLDLPDSLISTGGVYNRNSSERAVGKKPNPLSSNEIHALRSDSRISHVLEKHFALEG